MGVLAKLWARVRGPRAVRHAGSTHQARYVVRWLRCASCNVELARPGETMRVNWSYSCGCGTPVDPARVLACVADPIIYATRVA